MSALGLGLWPLIVATSAGGFSLSNGASFVAAGDSITDNGSVYNSTLVQTVPRGYWSWAYCADGRIVPDVNPDAGVSGNRVADLAARYVTDVINQAPNLVFLLIGTNNVTDGTAASTILTAIQSFVTQNRAIGAGTIIGRILPRGSVGVPMSAPQIAIWEAVNTGISAMATSDVQVWDAEPLIGSMNAQHTILAGHTTSEDLLHPNTLAAQKISSLVEPLIANWVAAGTGLFTSDNAVGNLLTGGFLPGTGGSNSGSTGQVATSWAATNSLTGGAAMACSKVARAAGGEWQQVVLSGTYTGSNITSDISRTYTIAVTAGQKVQSEFAFEIDGALENFSTSSLLCQFNGGSSIEVMAPASAETAGPVGPYTRVFRSIPLAAPIDYTSVTIRLRGYLLNQAGSANAAATFRFGALGLKIVP